MCASTAGSKNNRLRKRCACEEKVTVERRPVDRPATDADFAAAARKVIELTEAAEEPVVNKRARVVEEVVVHKDVTEHNAVQGETAMPLYDKGDVRIHYEEVGAGFPLLVIPGGGLNSTVAGLATHPFNPFDEFKDEFRVIAADLRNAKGSQSTGPLEVGRPWDAYTDDQLGLMDHLGIQEFMVLGFCIGGPFIWNLLQRAGDRVVAAVLAQPSGYRPEMPDLSYTNNMQGWGRSCAPPTRHHDGDGRDLPDQHVPGSRRLRVYRDPRFCARLPDADPGPAGRRAGAPVRRRDGDRASGAERAGEPVPWKDTPDKIPLAVRHIRTFLRAHQPVTVTH